VLKTAPEGDETPRSTVVTCIDRTTLQKKFWVFRLYGLNHPKNDSQVFPLEGNAFGLKQVPDAPEYVLVLCDNQICIFNVMAATLVRTIQFQGMFQRAIPVMISGRSIKSYA